MNGKLYIVATPIGNLADLSERAIESLRLAEIVAAEDTRRTGNLLHHLQIKKKMVSLFIGNEKNRSAQIMEALESGQNVAIVSDAGTPLVSDPGFNLVRDAIKAGIEIVPVPGPSAILAALVASGLPADRFTFAGYPPEKSGRRKKWFEEVAKLDHTVIMFLSPWKIKFMLKEMMEIFGDRQACVGRELTKVHEEFIRGSLLEIIKKIDEKNPRGEYTLVIAGPNFNPSEKKEEA